MEEVIATIFVFTASVGLISVIFYKFFQRKPVSPHPPNTVILHFKRHGTPDLSPFVLKLEIYLKLCKIPYQIDRKYQPSSVGKIPWIEYNGEIIEDSQFCVDYLNEKFNVNIDSHLTPYERSLSRAFQVMVEENTTWCLLLSRWVYERKMAFFKSLKLNFLINYYATRKLTGKSLGHGLGAHQWEKIKIIAKKDLAALSEFLGKKDYLFGNSMTLADCTVFGLLVQICYNHTDSYLSELVNDCYPNLKVYCERIKNKYYPDIHTLSG
ncbi:failed axon connections homolog [Argonauta hians]